MAFSRLLTLFLVVSFSVNTLSQDWRVLCRDAPNMSLCYSILRADPRSRDGHDINVLNQIFVEKAEEGANSTVRLANSLAEKANTSTHEQELVSWLTSCARHYDFALRLYKEVHEFLNSQMNDLAHNRAIAARHEGEVCVGDFEKPPSAPE